MTHHVQDIQALIDERDHLLEQLASLTGINDPNLPGLSQLESRIVRALEHANGRVLPRDALLNAMYWDKCGAEPQSKTIDVYMSKIRKRRPDIGRRIETCWGVGYSLRPEDRANG